MSRDAIGNERVERVLDLRAVFGIVARVTTPTEATGGEYVEMDIMADPGAKTLVHIHLSMAQSRYRADKAVKPPQWFFNVLAWIGRRVGYTID